MTITWFTGTIFSEYPPNITQDHHLEQLFEIVTAGGQYDPMRVYMPPPRAQGHVRQVATVQELGQRPQERVLEIVPPQAELLALHRVISAKSHPISKISYPANSVPCPWKSAEMTTSSVNSEPSRLPNPCVNLFAAREEKKHSGIKIYGGRGVMCAFGE